MGYILINRKCNGCGYTDEYLWNRYSEPPKEGPDEDYTELWNCPACGGEKRVQRTINASATLTQGESFRPGYKGD